VVPHDLNGLVRPEYLQGSPCTIKLDGRIAFVLEIAQTLSTSPTESLEQIVIEWYLGSANFARDVIASIPFSRWTE
jgi:hypothetical protein